MFQIKLVNISLFYPLSSPDLITLSGEPKMKIASLDGNSFYGLSNENTDIINSECSNNKLNPYYVTGFIYAEGCFRINIHSRSDLKLGNTVNLMFKFTLHSRDKVLLENIRKYFSKVGNITTRKNGIIDFIVSSIKDIEIIIEHFDGYPFITHK